MPKQCNPRVTKLFYSDDNGVFITKGWRGWHLHYNQFFCISHQLIPERFLNDNRPLFKTIIRCMFLVTQQKFYSLLIYYLLGNFARWQTQGNDNKTTRSKRAASTWYWSEAAGPTLVIPHLCLSAATLCSCVPCPLPWATTKALGISEAFVFIPRTYLPSCRTVTVKLTLNYAVSIP